MINIIVAIIAMACSILFATLAMKNSDDLGQMILLGILALMAFVGFIWAIVNPGVGTGMFNVFAYITYLLGITDIFLFVLYCAAHSC